MTESVVSKRGCFAHRLRFALRGLVLALFAFACSTPPSATLARDEARRLIAEGQELQAGGRNDEALAAYDAAIAQRPLSVEAHRLRQNLRAGRLEAEALHREYRALRERHPHRAAAHYLYGRLAFLDAERLASFRRARELDPRFAWAHHAEAHVLLRAGRPAEAEVAVRRARALAPANYRPALLLADILLRREESAEAVGVLEGALKLEPKNVALLTALVRARLADGRSLEALDAAEEVLGLQPSQAATRARLAGLAESSPETPEGYLAWRLLEDLHARATEDDAGLELTLARARHARGQHAEAATAARRALALGLRHRAIISSARAAEDLPLAESFRAWAEAKRIDLGPENPRLQTLARALADRARGSAADLRRLRALRGAGWVDEALRYGAAIPSPSAEIRAELKLLRDHRRFMAELALFAREERARGEAGENLAAFLGRVRARLEARGFRWEAEERIMGFAFLGEVLDLTEVRPGTLNAYLGQFNQILVAGRWAGEPAQIMLATLAAPPRHHRPEDWPDDFGYVEILAENPHITPPDASELGRAFFRVYYINVDLVADARRRRMTLARIPKHRKARLLASRGLEASGSAERRALDHPLDASRALMLRSLELHPDLPLRGHVRAHEIGHVRDAAERLPVGANLLSNLLLALEAGFSADRLGGILEEKAQWAALSYGPSPHLALSDIVDFIPRGEPRGFHQRGYRNLLERFLVHLDSRLGEFPAIRSDRVLLHQLHHLTEDEIQRIARSIRF